MNRVVIHGPSPNLDNVVMCGVVKLVMGLTIVCSCVKQMTKARSIVHQPSRHGRHGKAKTYAKLVYRILILDLCCQSGVLQVITMWSNVVYVYCGRGMRSNGLLH